jgi:flap endonuclease-1
MDTLAFHAPILVRHLSYSEARKAPLQIFDHEKLIQDLGLNEDQFIDLCILLGCDYCEGIKGIGKLFHY